MRILIITAAILTLSVCSAAANEENLHYNIISLDAGQSKQVTNDVMVVIMQAATQKNSAAEAGRSVNEMMEWADGIIKNDPSVQHRTMNYQTHPVYQNKTIAGWSVNQQLRLQSEDLDSLTNTVGSLQQQLQVASMHFEVSPERRKQEIDHLVAMALDAFRSKAILITQTLKAQDYRIVNLSIRDNAGQAPYRGGVQMEAMAARAPAPVVEAGDSKVQVTVQGKIQLIF